MSDINKIKAAIERNERRLEQVLANQAQLLDRAEHVSAQVETLRRIVVGQG